MFIAIIEPFEEFAHPTVGIGVAKRLFNPCNGVDRTAHLGIEPVHELLLLHRGQQAIATRKLECREGVFASSDKTGNPALQGLGMDAQDCADCRRIVATIKQ